VTGWSGRKKYVAVNDINQNEQLFYGKRSVALNG